MSRCSNGGQWDRGRALAVWSAAGALLAVQAPGPLQVSVVRFYRGASLTFVEGFCRVPASAVSPLLGPGGGEGAAYRISLTVRDSAGLELTAQSWSRAVPRSMLGVAGASLVEHFAFAARSGRYTIDVGVTDSATGRVTRQRGEVIAFAASPGASDLLLGTSIRQAAGPADTVPGPGEVRKGDVFVEASGRPVLTPRQSLLGYYLELYAQAAETATVVARVRGAATGQSVATAPQQVPLDAGGGATRGILDLGGLPPGSYRLEVTAITPEGELVRSAEFGMVEADERGVYPTLTLDGKRRFLRKFWTRRDPTPGTSRNEEEDRFYARIAEATRQFREGGAAQIPGWRTDRGRIFIRYGPADEVLSRPQAGSTAPYEVWKYTKTRVRKFVFYDVTRFGNYALIWTDERREPSRPNWRELLGAEAVQDVERF